MLRFIYELLGGGMEGVAYCFLSINQRQKLNHTKPVQIPAKTSVA